MSYDYSENILVQESAGHLLEDEFGWRVELAITQKFWVKLAHLAGNHIRKSFL